MFLAQATFGISELVSGGPWLVVAYVMWHLLTKRMPAQDDKIDALRLEIAKLKLMLVAMNSTLAGVNPELAVNEDELNKLGGIEDE